MSFNTFGHLFRVTTWGESHGPAIGAVVDGCPPGVALSEALGIEVMPHFLPGLFVHLAAASPAVTWLEDFPLLEPLFSGWPQPAADGTMSPRTVPGHGLTLADDVLARFRLT